MKLKAFEVKIDSLMQEGYRLIAKGKERKGCDKWIDVWEIIKENKPEDVTTLKAIDDILPNMIQSVDNWCPDLEMELHNAGIEDKRYFHKRIEYCREFCEIFCDENKEEQIPNFKRAEAEAYFCLGEIEKCDELFKQIIEDYPLYVWGLIGWGDQFFDIRRKDYDMAEDLYLKALRKTMESRLKSKSEVDFELSAVYERLDDLYMEMDKPKWSLIKYVKRKMGKESRHSEEWKRVKKKYRLSAKKIEMVKKLGMNPQRFEKIADKHKKLKIHIEESIEWLYIIRLKQIHSPLWDLFYRFRYMCYRLRNFR